MFFNNLLQYNETSIFFLNRYEKPLSQKDKSVKTDLSTHVQSKDLKSPEHVPFSLANQNEESDLFYHSEKTSGYKFSLFVF